MQLRVGPWRYSLRISDGPLIHDGRERMGLCREASHEIVISSRCPAHLRIKTVFHELFHAWIFHTGKPAGIEAWCDLFATAGVSAMDTLAANGGKEALLRLLPGESPQPGAAKILLTRNRYCGKCQGTVAGPSVRCTPSPEQTADGGDGQPILNLALDCEHCDHTQHWQETAGINGLPSGIVVGEISFAAIRFSISSTH